MCFAVPFGNCIDSGGAPRSDIGINDEEPPESRTAARDSRVFLPPLLKRDTLDQ